MLRRPPFVQILKCPDQCFLCRVTFLSSCYILGHIAYVARSPSYLYPRRPGANCERFWRPGAWHVRRFHAQTSQLLNLSFRFAPTRCMIHVFRFVCPPAPAAYSCKASDSMLRSALAIAAFPPHCQRSSVDAGPVVQTSSLHWHLESGRGRVCLTYLTIRSGSSQH